MYRISSFFKRIGIALLTVLYVILKKIDDIVHGNKRNKRGRRRRRSGGLLIRRLIVIIIVILIIVLIVFGIRKIAGSGGKGDVNETLGSAVEAGLIVTADNLAAGYDYEGAIELLTEANKESPKQTITDKLNEYENAKANLVQVNASEVTHIFYHSLLVDPEQAFTQSDSAGFKQWMTTVTEFNNITQKLYDEGYVYVSLYDLVEETTDSEGVNHFKEKPIYLPEGKKAVVLSLDDLSYYYNYQNHGIASKLIVDENGKLQCEYKNADGSVEVGDFDAVPLLNKFIEEHPDASYHGARGAIALTGYNGVFGYRTDIAYKHTTGEELNPEQQAWLSEHSDYDDNTETEEAKKVAEALKASGWTLASHTWGHQRINEIGMDSLRTDTKKWKESVGSIVGDTDMIIFAHGADLASTVDSYPSNEKFKFLKGEGFDYYLNVDSRQYTLDICDLFVHQGRRNLDGYRLWTDSHGGKDYTSDLFDAGEMLDPIRTDMPAL